MKSLRSKSEVRDYVESELARTIRVNHPKLNVLAGTPWAEDKRGLTWTIEGPPDPWPQNYVIEARIDEGELLIWFGYSSAGAAWTHHMIRPAVHLSFEEITGMSRQYQSATNVFSLGAVLEFMLAAHEHHAGMQFPMNNHALT